MVTGKSLTVWQGTPNPRSQPRRHTDALGFNRAKRLSIVLSSTGARPRYAECSRLHLIDLRVVNPMAEQSLRASDSRELAVAIRDVHKSFRRGSESVEVLQGLALDVPYGEFLGLMGPSGSGKTTMLNLIAGLDVPTTGTVDVGGERISSMSEAELARWRTRSIGFIFQFYHLLPVMTAYENIELPLLLLPLTGAQRKQQVMTALDLVGLSNRMNHRPGQLSGGQQQRVGIARAIVTDPVLIVADEPTGDLDARSAEEILDLLGELQRSLEKTILLVTHDPRAAERADRVLHLDKGRLVDDAPVYTRSARTGGPAA
jgi:putative ABC transport system ATP-binding protein